MQKYIYLKLVVFMLCLYSQFDIVSVLGYNCVNKLYFWGSVGQNVGAIALYQATDNKQITCFLRLLC